MKKSPKETYQSLVEHSRKIRLYESISSLLHWDQETYMPKGGIGIRSEQNEFLASAAHKEKISAKFGAQLESLVDTKAKGLTFIEKRNVERWHRDHLLAKALPNRFVKEVAKISSEAVVVWAKARADNNFSLCPLLKEDRRTGKEKGGLCWL